jgi:hypothetical protein
MTAMEVSAEIPQEIVKGLESGLYERIGGAIRDVETQQVVAWLREAYELGSPVISEVLSLSSTAADASTLNLALSTMQFAVVMKRLQVIEKQLKEMKQILDSIDYKIDLSFYANFRAALDLAANAFTLSNHESRRVSSMQAINRFLEAEHHYTNLADIEIANQSQVADDYLYTLSLAYVTEVRCYLELDEIDTALQRLQEGHSVLRPRIERHVRTLLTSNPAAFLHPSLTQAIGLKRLTAVYRWLTPGVDETSVFEAQRANLFRLAQDPEAWVASLPPAIRLPVKSSLFSSKLIDDLTRQFAGPELRSRFAGLLGALPGNIAERAGVNKPPQSKEGPLPDAQLFAVLPGTLSLIELMIEHCTRFESYVGELQTLRAAGLSFAEWRKLAPPKLPPDATLVCVMLPRSVH